MPYETLNLSTQTPVLSWASHDLGPQESKMARNVASLPFVYKHVALMPDVHLGKGALVGSVLATKDAIIPAAVGVDIGCGMAAVQTPYTAAQLEGKHKQIRKAIEAAVPVGFEENKETDKAASNWQGWRSFKDLHKGVQRLEGKAMKQMGSLGGGNHFIEVCLDTEDQVWIMLHSGSRHIGNMLAQCHIDTAKDLSKLAGESLPDPDLAAFVKGTEAFDAYWRDLQWTQDYARYNRDVMLARVKRIVEQHLGGGKPFKPLMQVNCHHNYAEQEVHFGESVYVTRKGAVRAREEDYGIIPGSMGAKSFIVKGKGNAQSYCSCSHGAGRLMSRNKAKDNFSLDDLIQQTAGVECRKDRGVLDEIPGAYKPIDEVMAQQSDLVEVVATLKQVICVKG
ncbi:MAG TPA: RtcB family protein [Trichocoleus sp.]